jgi:hypothetical protein
MGCQTAAEGSSIKSKVKQVKRVKIEIPAQANDTSRPHLNPVINNDSGQVRVDINARSREEEGGCGGEGGGVEEVGPGRVNQGQKYDRLRGGDRARGDREDLRRGGRG